MCEGHEAGYLARNVCIRLHEHSDACMIDLTTSLSSPYTPVYVSMLNNK